MGYERFEKWKPANVLRDRIQRNPAGVSDRTTEVVSRIFESLNAVFSPKEPEVGDRLPQRSTIKLAAGPIIPRPGRSPQPHDH